MPKKVLRSVLSLIIIAGILLALWPLGQSVYANWNQRQLKQQWAQQPKTKVAQAATKTPKSQTKAPKSVWPDTRLIIPDADVDVVILDGWDDATLRRAPSHMSGSANPGQAGNCAIAGHRNVYGSYFYKIDSLMAGAPIELRTPDQTFVYRVISVTAVSETDTSVLQPPTGTDLTPLLTLVTCTIPRTPNRIIVKAALETSS